MITLMTAWPSVFCLFFLSHPDRNSCFTLHLCSIVLECWKYSISELRIVIKKSTLWCSGATGNYWYFLSFSKTRLVCLGQILGLVFSIICICWAINWWYTQLWCCSGEHDKHLIFSAASTVLFLFHSVNVKINNYCLYVPGWRQPQEAKKFSNQWMLNLNSKLFYFEVYCAFI